MLPFEMSVMYQVSLFYKVVELKTEGLLPTGPALSSFIMMRNYELVYNCIPSFDILAWYFTSQQEIDYI